VLYKYEHGSCVECGFSANQAEYEPRMHRRFHEIWRLGVKAPIESGTILVPAWGNSRLVKYVYNMARLAQEENGYDFSSFSPRSDRDGWKRYKTMAFLKAMGGRFVGYAVVRMTSTFGNYNWQEGKVSYEEHNQRLPLVGMIFTCGSKRRKRIARSMVTDILNHYRVGLQDLVWAVPFSEDGNPFLKRLYNEETIKVGYV